jgi:hypothetical protein
LARIMTLHILLFAERKPLTISSHLHCALQSAAFAKFRSLGNDWLPKFSDFPGPLKALYLAGRLTQPFSNVYQHHFCLMVMLPTGVPFPSSCDNEEIPIIRREKRTRRNALIGGQSAPATLQARLTTLQNTAAANGSKRPLLQRGISSSTPPIHEEKTHSPTVCQSALLSPAPPRAYTILSNSARTRPLPSIQYVLSSSSSAPQSHLPPPASQCITILTNPAREKQGTTQPRSAQSTQSNQNVSAAAPAPMRVPATAPVSILKAPTSAPRTPALAPAPAPATYIRLSKPAVDAGKGEAAKSQDEKAKAPLPNIVIHEPDSYGTGVSTWRCMVLEDHLTRSFAAELAMKVGNPVGAERRREHARPYRQTATATSTATSTPSVAVMVSRINARIKRAEASTRTHTGKPPVAATRATRMH